jgi:predicted restriction endonuclease
MLKLMDSGELKEKISVIKIWQRSGERAPHKPLLLLYAQRRLSWDELRLISALN